MSFRALRSHAGLALLAVLAVVLTAALRAPAAWLGDWLESRGKLRLVDARGTVWRGSALLGISNGERQITLLPGRVSWEVELASLAAGRVSARVMHSSLGEPLSLSLAPRGITIGAGSAQLPAAALGALGMPFTTVRPGGVLAARWSDIVVPRGARFGELQGEVQIDWREAQSALSSVAPLGHYRLRVSGAQDSAEVRLDTLKGPLHLQGGGTLKAGRLRFSGVAFAVPEMRAALNGLLGLLGPRSGDNVLLSLQT
jgi:general secretion pathway protein N